MNNDQPFFLDKEKCSIPRPKNDDINEIFNNQELFQYEKLLINIEKDENIEKEFDKKIIKNNDDLNEKLKNPDFIEYKEILPTFERKEDVIKDFFNNPNYKNNNPDDFEYDVERIVKTIKENDIIGVDKFIFKPHHFSLNIY